MKTTHFFKVLAFSAGIIVMLSAFPEKTKGQPTAGGSVVLAKCNSWVSYSVPKDCAYTKIKCIGKRTVTKNNVVYYDKARVDVFIDGVKTSYQIDTDAIMTVEPSLTATHTIKIVNIEKGLSGDQCGSRGPGDSDVRVYIPANVTNIKCGNLPTGTSCSVCKVSFDPISE